MNAARSIFILLALTLAACAASPGRITQNEPIDAINSADRVALKGYDPVAYFTEGKPVSGSPSIEYAWAGTQWRFTSVENRDAFAAMPEKYAPQYGGYCSYAISRGSIADIDPHQWAIVDGKLYLNNNSFAQSLWQHDRTKSIVAGDQNWPLVPKKK